VYGQQLLQGINLSVYLVDDGSTDGTAVAVEKAFPQVNLIKGSSNLFWNGGMRLAFTAAAKSDFDFYLWLNDDTQIYEDTISRLIAAFSSLSEQGFENSIIAGSTEDPETGELTYGGIDRGPWWQALRFSLKPPEENLRACDTMHGNCVLIPRKVFEIVGNLDPAFKHNLGDYDYGLRATRQKCQVWALPGYVGTCSPNPHISRVDDNIQSLSEMLDKTAQPKGLATKDATLHPFKEWKLFSQRHGGPFWPIFYLLPYRRLLFSFFNSSH
jgi:GT2 family glycosyltransferase